MNTVVVVGMASEKANVGERPGVQIVVGAGNAPALAKQLEATIANGADRIVSLGVAGALAPDLQVGEIVVGVSVCCEGGETIIHSDKDWATRLSRSLIDGPKPVTFPVRFANFVSTAAPVATVAARASLYASTAADAVDMESFIAASAATAHGIPLAILRVVLDLASSDLPLAARLPLRSDGSPDLEAILGSVMSNPLQIPSLLRLASWSERAMGNLAIALASIGKDFAAYPAKLSA